MGNIRRISWKKKTGESTEIPTPRRRRITTGPVHRRGSHPICNRCTRYNDEKQDRRPKETQATTTEGCIADDNCNGKHEYPE